MQKMKGYQPENDNTYDAEKPEEILDIMTKIGSIIFLESFFCVVPFIFNYTIDLTEINMRNVLS